MTDLDEHLLTAAKLREQARGDLDADPRLLDHSGYVVDDDDRAVLSFIDQADVDLGALREEVESTLMTEAATEAVLTGNSNLMAHIVGVTEQDLDASQVRLVKNLLDALHNDDAPAFVTAAGTPNTGKTNSVLLLAELRKKDLDDLLVISNFDSSITDYRVTSAHDLMVVLLEHRGVPKFIIIDEGSTHFDARTFRREVALQWTPAAKRFAKIGVDACAVICHTGKDVHPEQKALSNLPMWKEDKKTAEFYSSWDRDEAEPEDLRFSGPIVELEKAGVDYDPDDAAPWNWNLQAELFSEDFADWSEFLDALEEAGPTE